MVRRRLARTAEEHSVREERLKIAVFVDFDNIEIGVKTTLGVAFDIGTILEAIKERGEVVTKIAYGDWTRAGDYSRLLTQHAIKMVQRNLTPGGDKNGADINLALDALEMALTHDHIDAYVIVGGDSDFLSLVEKLKQYDKMVFVVGGRAFTSVILQRNCHEFIAYENLIGQAPRRHAERGGKGSQGVSQALPLVRRALKVLSEREVTPQLGLLKSTLLQLDSTFSEKNYGAGSFRDFAEKLEQAGALRINRSGRNLLVESAEGDGDEEATAPSEERAREAEPERDHDRERRRGESDRERRRDRGHPGVAQASSPVGVAQGSSPDGQPVPQGAAQASSPGGVAQASSPGAAQASSPGAAQASSPGAAQASSPGGVAQASPPGGVAQASPPVGRRDAQPSLPPGEALAAQQAEAVTLLRRVIENASTPPRWPMYVRNVKQMLRAAEAGFDERRYGFGGILDLLRGAQRDMVLRLERDRQGVLRVFPGPVLQRAATGAAVGVPVDAEEIVPVAGEPAGPPPAFGATQATDGVEMAPPQADEEVLDRSPAAEPGGAEAGLVAGPDGDKETPAVVDAEPIPSEAVAAEPTEPPVEVVEAEEPKTSAAPKRRRRTTGARKTAATARKTTRTSTAAAGKTRARRSRGAKPKA